jgi:hypothetical protein
MRRAIRYALRTAIPSERAADAIDLSKVRSCAPMRRVMARWSASGAQGTLEPACQSSCDDDIAVRRFDVLGMLPTPIVENLRTRFAHLPAGHRACAPAWR